MNPRSAIAVGLFILLEASAPSQSPSPDLGYFGTMKFNTDQRIDFLKNYTTSEGEYPPSGYEKIDNDEVESSFIKPCLIRCDLTVSSLILRDVID